MLTTILTLFSRTSQKVWMYLVALGLALLLAFRLVKAGGDKKEMEIARNTLEAVARRNKVEDDVNRLSDDDIISRLRESGWIRPDK